MLELILAPVGVLLFLGGFYTGLWIQRHSREVVEREVPKVVTTERVVEHEKPVVVQVPTPVRQEGGLIVTGKQKPESVLDEATMNERRRMQELINEQNPEL